VGEIRIMVCRQRVSGGRRQQKEIPRGETSGSGDPDVRCQNERNSGTEYKAARSGQNRRGSGVIRMERVMIRLPPGAASENQRCSGVKSRAAGPVRAQGM